MLLLLIFVSKTSLQKRNALRIPKTYGVLNAVIIIVHVPVVRDAVVVIIVVHEVLDAVAVKVGDQPGGVLVLGGGGILRKREKCFCTRMKYCTYDSYSSIGFH